MATTARHNKGSVLQAVPESTFGVDPGTGYYDLRIEGDVEQAPKAAFSNALQPQTLYANARESEKPILVSTGVEDALKVKMGITRSASAGSDSQLVDMFESAGWTEDSGADTTVATATSQTSVILSADEGAAGRFVTVQLANGTYWPALVSSKATTTVTFACGLPSATSNGAEVTQCHTLTPNTVGPAGTSLTMRYITKALDGSSDNVMSVYTGCSLSKIGDLEITPGTLPFFDFTFNSASHNPSAITGMPANSFLDADGKKPCDGAYVQFANANASGAISSALVKLLSATITFGDTTAHIPGIGDAECIYNVQGNRQDPGDFVATMKFLYPASRISDWEGSNTSKYIGIVQPSANKTQPAWAFVWPNAYIMETPEWMATGDENMHIVTIKYRGNPAGYNSETGEDDNGNQPFYFGIATESA